ncbi:GPI mannosyltransferase 1 (GPI mannosyltransferase I) (GPI-MT-I) (Phosphatidylinositol-glycan biosynthesis class M protein) (PIG-M), partial [Durusdinium trenchii]
DEHLVVKYTDVDYEVFTDAAAAAWRPGGSPYDRATYRYPPVLAWLVLPNVLWFKGFGKLLFAACDLAVGWVIARILARRGGVAADQAVGWACVWLFHPYSVNISTRGNADVIVCLLVLLTLDCIESKRRRTAALFFGAAVHWKIFPIILAPTLVLHMDDEYVGGKSNAAATANVTGRLARLRAFLLQAFWQRLEFAVLSASTFFSLGGISYVLYGWDFLYEAYLYHFIRTDNRHNFSVYFYSLYLRYGQPAGLAAGLAAFVPQLVAQVALASALHRRLLLAATLQTIAFVAFNKVCTAQYFTWYTALLPLALATSPPRSPRKLWISAAAWLAAQLSWLALAYQLEFEGRNTFLLLWASGVGFFAAHLLVLAALLEG